MHCTAYHGTGTGGIRAFRTRPEENTNRQGHPLAKIGAWFSEHPKVAEFFARADEAKGPTQFTTSLIKPDHCTIS